MAHRISRPRLSEQEVPAESPPGDLDDFLFSTEEWHISEK